MRWVLRHQPHHPGRHHRHRLPQRLALLLHSQGLFPAAGHRSAARLDCRARRTSSFDLMDRKQKQYSDDRDGRSRGGQRHQLCGRLRHEHRTPDRPFEAAFAKKRHCRSGDRASCAENWRSVPGGTLFLQAHQDINVGGTAVQFPIPIHPGKRRPERTEPLGAHHAGKAARPFRNCAMSRPISRCRASKPIW